MLRLLQNLALLFTVALNIGCTITAEAKSPTPNVLPAVKIPGAANVAVTGATDEPLCSETAGLKDFCVEKLNSALQAGLTEMLGGFFKGAGPTYVAKFKVVDFSHDFASATAPGVMPAVRLSMKWQFVIEDEAGEVVAQMTGTTEGPEAFTNVGAADDTTKSLLDAVLEQIGAELNKMEPRKAPGDKGDADDADGDSDGDEAKNSDADSDG